MAIREAALVARTILAAALAPSPAPTIAVAAAPAGGLTPRRRTARHPRITPLPVNVTRWLQADVEMAAIRAASGDMTTAAQLYRCFARDGMIQLLGTRSGGLIRLLKQIKGTPAAVAMLQGEGGKKGIFNKIFPPSELTKLAEDGVVLGIGVAEFVQTDGDPYPHLVRLDPEFLIYRFNEDRWYYRTNSRLEPIIPGDGRWVLHTPKGQSEPWNHGIWQALARAYVAKEHGFLHRENYAGKVANPARVAVSPQGASDEQKQGWFQKVMAWGVNTVFGMTPGYDVKLLESNGRGHEVFQTIKADANEEIMVAICGQIVTVTGGAGFSNADIHATIRTDLIQGDGSALGDTLDTQALPAVLITYVGPGEEATVEWDTRPPVDLKAAAEALQAAAKAIVDLSAALAPNNLPLDVKEICARYRVPIKGDVNGDAIPDELAVEADLPIDSVPDAPPTDDEAALLAASMTEHGVARCEHECSNRCPTCGIVRSRELVPGVDGAAHTWRVKWRPIGAAQTPPVQSAIAGAPAEGG